MSIPEADTQDNIVAAEAGQRPRHIALFLHSLSGGGGTRVMMNLARAFLARGHEVDLLVANQPRGVSEHWIPDGARLIGLERSFRWRSGWYALQADREGAKCMSRPVLLPLGRPRATYYLPGLVKYLQRERPDAIIPEGKYCNITALWARRLAGVPLRVVITEHIALSARLADPSNRFKWKWRHALPLYQRVYPWADRIVSVSEGVGDDLAQITGIPREAITTIYNPVIDDDIARKAQAPVDHLWFQPGQPPVILGVGRLVPRKDFPTLIRAFARVRAKREARLIILGEHKGNGKSANALLALAAQLGVDKDVYIHGYADNPFAYMGRAGVTVLASRWEGLSNVLIEAMACGSQVVSTDCPHGPREVLGEGRFGPLVPVGDDAAMARAILQCLDNPVEPGLLRARADEFSIDTATEKYLSLLD